MTRIQRYLRLGFGAFMVALILAGGKATQELATAELGMAEWEAWTAGGLITAGLLVQFFLGGTARPQRSN